MLGESESDALGVGFAGLCEADISVLQARHHVSSSSSYHRRVVVPDERGVPVDEAGNFVDVDTASSASAKSKATSARQARGRAVAAHIRNAGHTGLNGYQAKDKAIAQSVADDLNMYTSSEAHAPAQRR